MSLSAVPPEDLPEDANLLKEILPPLLNDFQNWFRRTLEVLDKKEVSFLTAAQKQDLINRVEAAKQQVSAAQAMSAATDGQAAIDMPVVMSWHKLLHECWGVAIRLRREGDGQAQDPIM